MLRSSDSNGRTRNKLTKDATDRPPNAKLAAAAPPEWALRPLTNVVDTLSGLVAKSMVLLDDQAETGISFWTRCVNTPPTASRNSTNLNGSPTTTPTTTCS